MQFDFNCTKTSDGLQKPQCMFCNIVFLNAYLKPSELQDHFNYRNSGANNSGPDVESLKPKRIRFESRATLPKLDFVFADKPF